MFSQVTKPHISIWGSYILGPVTFEETYNIHDFSSRWWICRCSLTMWHLTWTNMRRTCTTLSTIPGIMTHTHTIVSAGVIQAFPSIQMPWKPSLQVLRKSDRWALLCCGWSPQFRLHGDWHGCLQRQRHRQPRPEHVQVHQCGELLMPGSHGQTHRRSTGRNDKGVFVWTRTHTAQSMSYTLALDSIHINQSSVLQLKKDNRD